MGNNDETARIGQEVLDRLHADGWTDRQINERVTKLLDRTNGR